MDGKELYGRELTRSECRNAEEALLILAEKRPGLTSANGKRIPGPEKNAGRALRLRHYLFLLLELPEHGKNQKLHSAPSSAGNQCF